MGAAFCLMPSRGALRYFMWMVSFLAYCVDDDNNKLDSSVVNKCSQQMAACECLFF